MRPPLTTYGEYWTCFIANHAISAKSHLIEWVGSFWSNTAEKCALRLNQPCLIWYVGCIIIGLCLSICLIVNYDRLAAWVPHCNGVWLKQRQASYIHPRRCREAHARMYTPTRNLLYTVNIKARQTHVHAHTSLYVHTLISSTLCPYTLFSASSI